MWWVKYKVTGPSFGTRWSAGLYNIDISKFTYSTPFTPCKPAIESNTKPAGNYWGPYHCAECANTCASFGKTEEQAWEFSHGTDDQKFAVFLSG